VISYGEHPSRAVVGEYVPISATVFREGHDAIAASVCWRSADGTEAGFNRMVPLPGGLNRWRTEARATEVGLSSFVVEAWSDPLATWYHAVEVKLEAGQDAAELANDLEIGARLFEQVALSCPEDVRWRAWATVAELRGEDTALSQRVNRAFGAEVRALARDYPVRELITRSPRYDVWVDRERALYGAWYEFFPRSINAEVAGPDSDDPSRPVRHGTFADATEHLDYVADLGFDVVYLPPIHPIGRVNRKGPNNTLDAKPTDTGSPWAIGSAEGGHDAIHPELGTEQDFAAFVDRARELDLEVALDLAFQCAPDHPWVTEHPKWFTSLPDGSIAFAENPPKKYQDIYPLNFDNDPAGLANELLRVVELWVSRGVEIFRVDNPHTKPLSFWQWLIRRVKAASPNVLFLAEAFTSPAMMHELARVGFTQSYTYFTWRNSAAELAEYGTELVAGADYMRPNFFPTTPDILNSYLVEGGPSAFTIRAVLAATMSPSYGIYSGYELFENVPVRPGSEEFLDSEKFQLRPRDLTGAIERGQSLAPFLKRLNEIRRAHPSLHRLRNLQFHDCDNTALLSYSKHDPDTGDTILVVVSMDPHFQQEGFVTLDIEALGLGSSGPFAVTDLVDGSEYTWAAKNYVRLIPYQPAHILHVRGAR
jgi:starch synthase (maltosyl-transferring)